MGAASEFLQTALDHQQRPRPTPSVAEVVKAMGGFAKGGEVNGIFWFAEKKSYPFSLAVWDSRGEDIVRDLKAEGFAVDVITKGSATGLKVSSDFIGDISLQINQPFGLDTGR